MRWKIVLLTASTMVLIALAVFFYININKDVKTNITQKDASGAFAQSDFSRLSENSKGMKWNLLKHENLSLELFDINVTEDGNYVMLCVYPKVEITINDPRLAYFKAYAKSSDFQDILDITESISMERSGNKLLSLCIETTSEIYDYISFGGENDTIIAYEETKSISMNTYSYNITAELFKSVNGKYQSRVNNVTIIQTGVVNKFGAYDKYNSKLADYKYIIEGKQPLVFQNNRYYFPTSTGLYQIDTSDICGYNHDVNMSANCTFNVYNISDTWYLEIEFYNYGGFIDPAFVYYYTQSDIINNHTSSETTNLTHITQTDSGVYSSLVAYYSFDMDTLGLSDTYAHDSSGYNHDCSYNNKDTFWTASGLYDAGVIGDGKSTPAANQRYITCGDITYMDNINSTAIMAWIVTDSDGYDYVLGKYAAGSSTNGWGLYNRLGGDDSYYFYWGSEAAPIVYNYGAGAPSGWHHLAGVSNGTNLFIYWDGVLKNTSTCIDCTSKDNIYDFYIGRTASGSPGYWEGKIDEVMLFNSSLNSSQILEIYNNQSARFQSSGQATMKPFRITPGNNTIDLNLTYVRRYGTNISARILSWDISKGYDLSSYSVYGIYSFDNDTSTTSYDNSEYGFNGVYYNGSAHNDSVNCWIGNCTNYPFNSQSYIATSGSDAYPTANLTVSVWFRPQYTGGQVEQYLISKEWDSGAEPYSSFGISLLNQTTMQYIITEDSFGLAYSLQSPEPDGYIDANVWHHAVLTYDSEVLRGYLDGKLIGSRSDMSGGIYYESAPMYIGARDYFDGATHHIQDFYNDGYLDEIYILGETLTLSEIQTLYEQGLNQWTTTDYQNLSGNTTDTGSNNNFSINQTADTLIVQARLDSGQYKFYTPYLDISRIDVLTYGYSEGEPPEPPTDSCTYSSGDWLVDCSHDCNITSDVNLGGNDLLINGSGYFNVFANITNYNLIRIIGTDASNKCIVRTYNGAKLV